MMRPGLGCPPCNINFGSGGCLPCEPDYDMPECRGCFDAQPREGFFARHDIWPAVVSGVIIAVATGITINALNKQGIRA